MVTTHSAVGCRRLNFGGRRPSSMISSLAFLEVGGAPNETGLHVLARAGLAAASSLKPLGITCGRLD